MMVRRGTQWKKRVVTNKFSGVMVLAVLIIGSPLYLSFKVAHCQSVAWKGSSYSCRGQVGKDTVSIFMSRSPFDSSNHTLSSTGSTLEYSASGVHPVMDRIDGHDVWGTVVRIPRYALIHFELSWNSRAVKIPEALYSVCCDPHLNLGAVTIAVSDDRSSVNVRMNGSDGTGACSVTWTIRRNGNVARYIAPGE